jgi:hypothetical protein
MKVPNPDIRLLGSDGDEVGVIGEFDARDTVGN